MNESIKVQYLIGRTTKSLEYPLFKFLDFLNKQLQLSIPLITGVNITYRKNKKEFLKRVYVGKEIDLKEYYKDKYIFEKYDISMSDLAEIAVLGYKRACLLNFKKYDQVIVGIDSDAIVVPDYYSLKKVLNQIENSSMMYI